MILIAHSGVTKTDWVAVDGTTALYHANSEGINPYIQNRREISRSIRLGLPKIFFEKKFKNVYFYGIGCSSQARRKLLESAFMPHFKTSIHIESDILGAARGLFLDEKGIACIVDTASNSCLYNGNEIVKNIRSGGFILGDEGSSSVLGKLFISDLIKGLVPRGLSDEFTEKFGINISNIIDDIYSRHAFYTTFSSISFFLNDHLENSYVNELIKSNIRNFFFRTICQYDYLSFPVRIVGSAAVAYSQQIEEVAKEFGIIINKISESPMKGLIAYHAQHPQP